MQPSNLPSARATPATNSGNTPGDSLYSPTPADRPRSPLGANQDRPMCYFPKANLHHSPNRPNEVGIPIEFLLSSEHSYYGHALDNPVGDPDSMREVSARLRSRQARREPHRPTSPRVVVVSEHIYSQPRSLIESSLSVCVVPRGQEEMHWRATLQKMRSAQHR